MQMMPDSLREWWTDYVRKILDPGGAHCFFVVWYSNHPLSQLNPTYTDFTNELLGAEYKESAWYLQLMGVEPGLQGHGTGSALLRYGEDLVRKFPS